MMSKPIYQHDCDACRYLGSGSPDILNEHAGRNVYDFYVCEAGAMRSMIARCGNQPSEYLSNALFVCVELTILDQLALFNGLELTPEENERLLRVFASMYRDKLTRTDCARLSAGDAAFGSGNVVFEHC